MQTLLQQATGIDELAAVAHSASIAATRSGSAGRPAPWRSSQIIAAQSRSSVLNRRDPSWPPAAGVSDGANSRSEPGQRRSISAAHARSRAGRLQADHRSPTDVAGVDQPLELPTPTHSTASVTGSPISPRSPVVNHTD